MNPKSKQLRVRAAIAKAKTSHAQHADNSILMSASKEIALNPTGEYERTLHLRQVVSDTFHELIFRPEIDDHAETIEQRSKLDGLQAHP